MGIFGLLFFSLGSVLVVYSMTNPFRDGHRSLQYGCPMPPHTEKLRKPYCFADSATINLFKYLHLRCFRILGI